MNIDNEHRIPASINQVWDALNDPEVLAKCIPGCKELVKGEENEFIARVVASVGPVKATFKGNVLLQDIEPLSGYTLVGEGKGGAAGFAKMSAVVNLKEEGDETLLNYSVQASVGGKLAQIGSRLVQGAAKKMADQFFTNFCSFLAGDDESQDRAQLDENTEEVKDGNLNPEVEKKSQWKRLFTSQNSKK